MWGLLLSFVIHVIGFELTGALSICICAALSLVLGRISFLFEIGLKAPAFALINAHDPKLIIAKFTIIYNV